jgi:hypothetical protein
MKTIVNKRAEAAMEALTATLDRWLDGQIAGLAPERRRQFDDLVALGWARYDAFQEVEASQQPSADVRAI